MGELIAFKPAKCGSYLRAAPSERGIVVIFTGVRTERLEDLKRPPSKAAAGRRTRGPLPAPYGKEAPGVFR
jgi:hypothetical protein